MREIIVIAMHMDGVKILCEIPFKDKTLTELDVRGKNLGTEGALVVAEYLDGNGAMSSLNFADNAIGGYYDHTGFHATPEGTGFILSHTLPFLSLSMSGPAAIADAIENMGALLHFDISNNDIRAEGGKALVEALKGNQVINTLSIAGNNLSFNSSGDQDMSALVALSDVIPGMRAMTCLDVSDNVLCAEGTQLLAEALKGNQIMTELNISSNYMTSGGLSGVVALADAIPEMGTMTSLNLASNELGIEGAKIIATCLPKCT
jgi:Ran GTPase-activating protein (RanGAP) involved in mRNA processing and transport